MPKYLYLYTDPFVIPDVINNRNLELIDHFDDDDRADLEKIYGIALKFAIDEKLIDINETGITKSKNEDTSSFIWFINWMNFRSLVSMNQYGKLMSSMQTGSLPFVDKILELHVRLGCLFNEKLLNTLANRIIQSISLIPFDIKTDDQKISWEKIHVDTPFIWLVILIQVIINSEPHKDI